MTQQTINALFNVKEYFDAPAFEKALLKAFGAIGPELLIQPILTPDDFQTLFIALEKAPHIKTLKFTQGALNDINSSFIAKALASNTTLTTVDLSYTTLSFEAYYALASLLLDHKTLKNMNLRTDTFEDINVIGLALTPFMPTGVNFYLRGSSVYNLTLSELPSYVREPRLVNCEPSACASTGGGGSPCREHARARTQARADAARAGMAAARYQLRHAQTPLAELSRDFSRPH